MFSMALYVKKLNKQGVTIILTTHYLEEAEKLCDEVAIINKGKIIAQDKTSQLKRIFGNRQLIVKLKNKIKAVPASLKKDLDTILLDSSKLVINFKTGDVDINKLLQILTKEKLAIEDFQVKESGLEEIFTYLVNQ